MNTDCTLVPHESTLAGFVEAVSHAEGVDVRAMQPLTSLAIWTENSLYRIILREPDKLGIVVQGGRFFTSLTEARLAGSSFGGSLLKVAWIGLGLRLEICTQDQRIVTSRVRAIAIEQDVPPRSVH